MDLLTEVKKLEGRSLLTLDRRRKFTVKEVLDTKVVIETSTDKSRVIPWDSIQESWEQLERIGEITRIEIRKFYSNFNPAYVAVILASVPEVSHSIRPITLRFRKDGKQ